jgi:hypothetical protein
VLGTYGKHGGEKKCMRCFSREMAKKNNFVSLGTGGRIILKLILGGMEELRLNLCG